MSLKLVQDNTEAHEAFDAYVRLKNDLDAKIAEGAQTIHDGLAVARAWKRFLAVAQAL